MTREELRKAMPFSASCVAQHRKLFGEPGYIKATEGGHEINWGVDPIGEGVEVTPVIVGKKSKSVNSTNERKR